jgi:multidrug resistance efflux pump
MDKIKEAYIVELEQRLSDWWVEITELEVRMKKADVDTEHQMFVQIQALRQQRDETKAILQSLRESDHSEWQSIKEKLEKAWLELRSGLDKMARGFAREWDESDK